MDKNLSKLSKNPGVRKNRLCRNVLLWTSFCFTQVDQQKHVGLVSSGFYKNM